jgi:nucleotide-binding universal stress UspA family protein
MNNSAGDASPRGFARILLCVDGSFAAAHAAAFTRRLAGSGTTVRIAGVVENPRNLVPLGPLAGFDQSAAHVELLEDTEVALATAREAFAGSPATVDTQLIDLVKLGGDVPHAIVAAAADWHADLLVLGARQHHGLLRWVEGVVGEPVRRLARCPMIVVPVQTDVPGNGPPMRLLFAVDGSRTSGDALLAGARLAPAGAAIRVISVIDRAVRYGDFVPVTLFEEAIVEEGRTRLQRAEALLAHLPDVAQVSMETALIETRPDQDDIAHAIAREAEGWRADLLVLGTHGRRGPARWLLGSVASRVARITKTPLMLVRGSERQLRDIDGE